MTMRRIFIYLMIPLLTALLVGCPEPNRQEEETPTPPMFGKGDMVALKQGSQVGLVLKVHHKKDKNGRVGREWFVTVLFREEEMEYPEAQLRMVERMDWNRTIIKGEVEPGKAIKTDP